MFDLPLDLEGTLTLDFDRPPELLLHHLLLIVLVRILSEGVLEQQIDSVRRRFLEESQS